MKREHLNKALLFFILLLGAGLRIYKIGVNSLWLDEASFIFFRADSESFLENLKFTLGRFLNGGSGLVDYGYRFFSSIWSIFFESELMLRFPSAIFGIFCIFLVFMVGKTFFDKRTGIIAAFILAISPFHIYYSQEFRPYSLISMLTLSSVYFLWRFLQDGKYRFLCGLIVSHILNLYMHILTGLILLAQVMFFINYLRKYRNLFAKWLAAQIIIVFLTIPLIILQTQELIRVGKIESILRITVSTTSQTSAAPALILFYTLKNFCIGFYAVHWVGWFMVLLFSLLFIRAQIKTREREALHLCLFCLFIPMFIMFACQKFLYADRYLIPSSLFLYLIVSRGASSLKKPVVISVLILILILCSFTLNNYYRGFLIIPAEQRMAVPDKQQHREAAKYILDNFQEEDVIFHTESNTGIPFVYYFKNYFIKRLPKQDRIFSKERISLVLYFTKKNELSCFKSWAQLNDTITKTDFPVKGHKRVWLVFSSWHFDKACKQGSEERKKLEWMEKEYMKKEETHFRNITVYLFENFQNKI